MTGAVTWLAPWYPVDDPVLCQGLERQLLLEIAAGHILERETLRLIARRDDTDDALFSLADGRVAEVHMTWRRSRETDPRWPATAVFASLDEWGRRKHGPAPSRAVEPQMRPRHAAARRRLEGTQVASNGLAL